MDRKWWTLIAVCVGTFMLLLDVTIVNVALPVIQSSLHASFSDLQWVVDAYSLMLAALLLTTGSLADLFGRRRLFVIGLVIFTISSLASGLATTPVWLNLARGAQGVGGAAMFSTSLALLGSAFQGRERGTAFGVWGAITGLAVAIGPVVGGALTTGLSWRWIFLVNVPIGVIAVILCVLRVEESRQPGAHRPDIIGVITFSGALGALVYALIKANAKGWGSGIILVCLAGAAVLLIAFVIAELVQREPMFDLGLFRKPTFTGGSIAAFALSGGLFALFLYLTLYLQDVLGYSALQTGLRFLVLSGGILLTSTLAGRLTSQVPIRFLIAPGLLLVGVGLLLMRGLNAGTGWTHLIPGFIIAGAGAGLINPPPASTAIGVVTPDRAGMASGINSTFRQVGIATGIAGLGTLFAHVVRTHIVSMLHGVSGITAQSSAALASTVAQGSGAGSGLGSLPARARPAAAHAVKASFTTGLNEIFLVGAILTLVAAVLTLVLIRSKDFEASAARSGQRPPSAETSETSETAESAETAEPPAAEPEPEAPAEDVVRSADAVIATSEQAALDYGRQVERRIERHRAAQLAAAEAQSRALLEEAMERNDRYAAALRSRLAELGGERERLVTELRDQIDSVARHADQAALTRAQLYRVIGALGALPADANGADGEPADGSGNGQGRHADWAPSTQHSVES
ncbi:MAG: MFS transporter [Solirubrobacteraceae bacterium]